MFESDLKHPSPALEEKLQTLYTLNRDKAVDLSFRPPFLNILEKFGNPHLNLPPVIHVAGTNGKGSTIATLKSIYEAAGYSVHAYTSPHLIRFNERIVIDGKPIDNNTLESLIDEAIDINGGASCTFFEITTAIAFAAFVRNPADICLLEVGMGGRLDCTNIIPAPALSLINTIGLDHTEFLGDTIEDIAAEKGGIIKPNVTCIIGHQNDDSIYNTLTNIAAEKSAALIKADTTKPISHLAALNGAHQKRNMNLALTAIEHLQNTLPVTDTHIKNGLATINWPARLQPLNANNLNLPDTAKIWLDGGHNEDAAHAIAQFLQTLNSPAHLIVCMMKHKDPATFVKPLLPYLNAITCTEIPNEPASLNAQALSQALVAADIKTPIYTAPDYKTALQSIDTSNNILIAGSLYLAGHVLQDIEHICHN